MSIIDEALKKTQENLNQKKQNPDDKSVTDIYEKLHKTNDNKKAPPIPEQSTPKKNNPLIGILILMILIVGLYYGFQFYASGQKKDINVALNKFKASFSKSKVQKQEPAIVKPKVYNEDEIVLNGIMSTTTRQTALINDKIYEIGDEIKSKKITNISVDEVELTDESGVTTKLTTRN